MRVLASGIAPATADATSAQRTYLPFEISCGRASAPGANLLANGSFEATAAADPLPGWVFTVRAAAAATLARDDRRRRRRCRRADHDQPALGCSLIRSWPRLACPCGPDQTFQLSFWARAAAPRVATVTLQQDSTPWHEQFPAPRSTWPPAGSSTASATTAACPTQPPRCASTWPARPAAPGSTTCASARPRPRQAVRPTRRSASAVAGS